MIGPRCRGQVSAERRSVLLHTTVHGRQVILSRRHDIAVDVATRGERIHHCFVNATYCRFQARLDYAMQLKGLPRRQTDRAVRMRRRNPVHIEPLCRRANSCRYSRSYHETVHGFEPLTFSLTALVTIVLLVDAVKLGQLCVVIVKRTSERIDETVIQRAAQVLAVCLYSLNVRRFTHQ